jgi:hypothetical protein
MGLRLHRYDLVVWSSSAGPAGRCGAPRFMRHTRAARIRRRIRTGALFTVFGLMRLACAVRARRGGRLLLAGAVLTVAGSIVPSPVTVICGTLVLLRALAVALGVSEPHHTAADFAGFKTPPPG